MAAAIATSAIGELGTLIGGTGIGSTLARGALTGIGAVAAGDLISAIAHDLAAGGAPAAQARRSPQFAIVDLHSNKVVRFLSTRRVYSILTHPSRRSNGRYRRSNSMRLARGTEVVIK